MGVAGGALWQRNLFPECIWRQDSIYPFVYCFDLHEMLKREKKEMFFFKTMRVLEDQFQIQFWKLVVIGFQFLTWLLGHLEGRKSSPILADIFWKYIIKKKKIERKKQEMAVTVCVYFFFQYSFFKKKTFQIQLWFQKNKKKFNKKK